MGARRDINESDGAAAGVDDALERSLEEFIVRANTTLPPTTEGQAAAIRGISKGKRKAGKGKDGGTMVVLGSDKPLAEVTEIVTRLPAGTLDEPPRRSWFSLRLAAAFVAGAAAVLVLTRFLTGSPEPVQPVVTSPPAAPPIVVEPIIMPAPMPVPQPAAAVAPEPTVDPEPEAKPATRKKPARPARKPPMKQPGLVDPFAE